MMVNGIQTLLAQTEPAAESMLELEFPESTAGRVLWLFILCAMVMFVVYTYIRDTRALAGFWRFWLLGLRLGAVAALAIIALNPSRRTPEMLYRPSQLAIVVDTSLSMGYPELDRAPGDESEQRTRTDAVRDVLLDNGLLEKLQQDHQVSVYSFDTQLEGPHVVLPYKGEGARLAATESNDADDDESAEPTDASQIDWKETLRPKGLDTRMGDAVRTLVGRVRSRTLSGVMVVGDGESNAGFHPDAAHDAAQSSGVRLVSVGVGGTEPQKNLQLVSMQAPSVARSDDAFEIRCLLQGQGFAGQQVVVELERSEETEGGDQFDPVAVESKEITLFEDGVPEEVVFAHQPSEDQGNFEYTVRIRPSVAQEEWSVEDNERKKSINLTLKRTRVLLAAGGPLREYRFVRNMLFRHPGIRVDVWLQTVDASAFSRVSQESDELLAEFPQSLTELDVYDVVVAFDPDWRLLTEEQRDALVRWVNERSGGLVVCAGDVYTPELAAAGEDMDGIRELYPVFLSEYLLAGGLDSESDQAWTVGLTDEGREAGFLMLDETPEASVQGRVWDRWEGVYRSYPTAGAKAGATIYSYFSDVRAQTEHGLPILMASQFFGSGRTFYLGTSEFWRMRSESEEFYDRFWTKLVREVGQGRRNRGTSRGILLLERNEYALGQTVRLRARLYDRQLNELDVDSVELAVTTPTQKFVDPPPKLMRDPNQPGQFAGDFRVSEIGNYRIELEIPDGKGDSGGEQGREVLVDKVDVRFPNLEAEHPEQNVQVMKNLVRDTGGTYLSLGEAAARVPELFTNKGEEIVVSEWPETLWDRSWVLYALVGLLSLEWLTRKLLKLA